MCWPMSRRYPCSTKNEVSTSATSPASAWPPAQSSTAAPMIAVRKMTSIICWLMPLNVPRHQTRRVRLRHLATTLPSRSSSRPSPPKPLTTALHEIASASDPPIRVSHELARLAAGATQVTDNSAVTAM